MASTFNPNRPLSSTESKHTSITHLNSECNLFWPLYLFLKTENCELLKLFSLNYPDIISPLWRLPTKSFQSLESLDPNFSYLLSDFQLLQEFYIWKEKAPCENLLPRKFASWGVKHGYGYWYDLRWKDMSKNDPLNPRMAFHTLLKPFEPRNERLSRSIQRDFYRRL